MKFIELTVCTTDEAEEIVSDIFWNYTDCGVAISAVDEVIKLLDGRVIYDYYDESILEGVRGVSLVKGFFPVETADKLVKLVRVDLESLKTNACFQLGSLETFTREVDGDDWISIWQKHFRAIKIGDITVCPEWIKCEEKGVVIKIDSNLAFGTGEHETTSMVVEFMQKYIKPCDQVLDVGTGSGILGVGAVLLGASKSVMTDIDQVAVDVAKRNAKLNNVSDKCEIFCEGDLSKVNGQFAVGLANITAEVLCYLCEQISSRIANGGYLITSGILNDRVEKVKNAFAKFGFIIVESNSIGEWSSLVLQKKL